MYLAHLSVQCLHYTSYLSFPCLSISYILSFRYCSLIWWESSGARRLWSWGFLAAHSAHHNSPNIPVIKRCFLCNSFFYNLFSCSFLVVVVVAHSAYHTRPNISIIKRCFRCNSIFYNLFVSTISDLNLRNFPSLKY